LKASVFLTTASLELGTGGGNVSYHEYRALARVTEVRRVLTVNDIAPRFRGLPDNPFLQDYIAQDLLSDLDSIHLAVFNGNPFGVTAKLLRTRFRDVRVIVDVPAHNLEESVEEFGRLGLSYPNIHMTDPYLWRLYTEHIRIADVVICPSKLSADYIARKLRLTNRIEVIPHGADIPAQAPPIPETFTVGHLGVNGPDKGQIYLVKAWNSLRLPESRILLAGVGTESWGGLGYVADQRQIYAESSVYVQPSVTEGFGIPVLEAMAHGRPVIVTDGCGSHELVEDGVEGFVVPIRSPEAIASKIRYFHDNPEEVRRMGEAARLKAMRYSWERVEREYERVFQA
jgi:glycosyltransferase involved in cell wall biosynthesis